MSKIRSRIYQIVQYEKHPITGEDLNFNESVIKLGLKKREKGLLGWAYVRHDKDEYVVGDDIPDGKFVGDLRPPHWHLILMFKSQAELSSVAKTFGVAEQYVDKMVGQGAFYDGVYYLTHEDNKQRELGKTVYDRSKIVVQPYDEATLDEFWQVVDDRELKRLKSIPQGVKIDKYIKQLNDGKLTLKELYKKDSVLATKNSQLFKKARALGLENATPPSVRVNYYLQGNAGAGKTLSAKMLARSLYPDKEDDEIFFVVGDGSVPFDGYDGQPVIIWDDWRAKDILTKFDRGTVWKLFAVNPDKISVNVKYSHVNLINAVSIITSVTPFKKFIDDLAGKYTDNKRQVHEAEDKNQGYRRFPVFLEITKESYQMYVSLAMKDGEYEKYQPIVSVQNNIIELAQNPTPQNIDKVMSPVKRVHQTIEDKYSQKSEMKEIDVTIEYHNKQQLDLFGDD